MTMTDRQSITEATSNTEHENIIRSALPHARQAASKVGSLHAAWDVIFTAESVIGGGDPWPYANREEALRETSAYLRRFLPTVGNIVYGTNRVTGHLVWYGDNERN
jgi:hypothetical protein